MPNGSSVFMPPDRFDGHYPLNVAAEEIDLRGGTIAAVTREPLDRFVSTVAFFEAAAFATDPLEALDRSSMKLEEKGVVYWPQARFLQKHASLVGRAEFRLLDFADLENQFAAFCSEHGLEASLVHENASVHLPAADYSGPWKRRVSEFYDTDCELYRRMQWP